eukprot:gene18153-27968_t
MPGVRERRISVRRASVPRASDGGPKPAGKPRRQRGSVQSSTGGPASSADTAGAAPPPATPSLPPLHAPADADRASDNSSLRSPVAQSRAYWTQARARSGTAKNEIHAPPSETDTESEDGSLPPLKASPPPRGRKQAAAALAPLSPPGQLMILSTAARSPPRVGNGDPRIPSVKPAQGSPSTGAGSGATKHSGKQANKIYSAFLKMKRAPHTAAKLKKPRPPNLANSLCSMTRLLRVLRNPLRYIDDVQAIVQEAKPVQADPVEVDNHGVDAGKLLIDFVRCSRDSEGKPLFALDARSLDRGALVQMLTDQPDVLQYFVVPSISSGPMIPRETHKQIQHRGAVPDRTLERRRETKKQPLE